MLSYVPCPFFSKLTVRRNLVSCCTQHLVLMYSLYVLHYYVPFTIVAVLPLQSSIYSPVSLLYFLFNIVVHAMNMFPYHMFVTSVFLFLQCLYNMHVYLSLFIYRLYELTILLSVCWLPRTGLFYYGCYPWYNVSSSYIITTNFCRYDVTRSSLVAIQLSIYLYFSICSCYL